MNNNNVSDQNNARFQHFLVFQNILIEFWSNHRFHDENVFSM